MAPKKSAKAETQLCPTMKLTIEKGPLSGQTNEFKPGSLIRIGRVVRGNTLTIKDAGISTKHLIIQCQPGTDHWSITDLGSSNGTVLNDRDLEPSEPVILAAGDVIKIGGMTSMRVEFEVQGAEGEGNVGNVRRNTKRRVRNQGGELGVTDEDSELGLWLDENNLGAGGKNGKQLNFGNEGEKLGDNVVQEKVRRGRPPRAKARDLKDEGKEVEDTTNSEKAEGELEVSLDEDKEKHENAASGVEGKEGNNNVSVRTRRLKKDVDLNVIENQRVSVRRTRSSRNEDICFDDLGIIEGKRKARGARAKSNLPKEPPLEKEKEEELNLEHDDREEEKMESLVGEKERESAAGLVGTSGLKKGTDEVGDGHTLKKLEEMTLGEWFDLLETSLPKQIIESTEELIYEMRQKAERAHEFKLQHTNAK